MPAKGKVILETARLVLRELTSEDAEMCFSLNSDPEVIRYTGDTSFDSVLEAQRFLNNYDHYRKYGMGRWGVIRKEDTAFLGWCGLKYSPDVDEYDIGFRFFKAYWNKGFATEAAKACVDLGFDKFKLNMIVGRAMKVNAPSIRVLTKIGLSYWKDDACGIADGVIYKIEKGLGTAVNESC